MLRFIFALLVVVLAGSHIRAEEVRIAGDSSLPTCCQLALGDLTDSLQTRKCQVVRDVVADDATIFVGIASISPSAELILSRAGLGLTRQPESLVIGWNKTHTTLMIVGHDARGLAYALREVARAVRLAPSSASWRDSIVPANESPALTVRNVSMHLFNADVDRDWYDDDDFWHAQFARLAETRFNQMTLTFSDQTNYLCPLYAYLVEMPEYPQVRVDGVTTEQRAQNLQRLRWISQLAADYGIDFNLGIWMQAPVPKYAAPVTVTGLPTGLELADYCALGLKRILAACPAIGGVQLRMNAEAGVPEDQQTAFYRPLFKVLAAACRPMRVELRYKGLQPTTTQAALDEGLAVTVSTKFWSEHFGLSYHPTAVDSHWSKDRYSFGAMLAEPRSYAVTYQLWNVGSQRITLWGDPEYAANFARNCRVGGGVGFEVFAPLTDKGYGDRPGAWPVVKHEAYRVGRWEQDKYWAFYLCFGRLGYNPDAPAEIWQREFRHRYGAAAADVERAYRAASRVLPLITAARLPGASEWSWWPEMDTGGNLKEYARIQPSDPAQSSPIRRWERTPDWRWEDWDTGPGYVEEVLSGQMSGRTTPRDVSRMLRALADEIDQAWDRIEAAEHPHDAEWRMIEVDVKLLGGLARYHAEKIDAATDWAFHEATKSGEHLRDALAALRRSHQAWQSIVAITDPVYHGDLVFGVTGDSPRSSSRIGHAGHWRDRLPEIEADVKHLEQLASQRRSSSPAAAVQEPGETAWKPKIQHHAPTPRSFTGGLTLRLRVTSDERPEQVVAHVRPLDQTRSWQQFEMRADGDEFVIEIPAIALDARFDTQFYFRVSHDKEATLWPPWTKGAPYFIVPKETQR